MMSCRDCPEHIRERCIQKSDTSPSVKQMMRRAFEAGTDTRQMWGLLQMNCLLVAQAGLEAQTSHRTSLMRRLRGEPEPVETVEEIEEEIKAVTPPPPPARPAVDIRLTTPTPPLSIKEIEGKRPSTAPLRYCIALQNGWHRIALPIQGEIVLGRFDPMISVTPDVDLSYYDRKNRVISRRHARIIGHHGHHEIEDLGSTNGTRVNGHELKIGQRMQLRPGDRVALGYREFTYIPLPELQILPDAPPPQAYLWVAFTGHQYPLPAWGEVVVGRVDRVVGFTPDIDLSGEGDVVKVVARRHIKIVARNGRHYMEDLGSANGTKLNGVPVGLGKLGLLNPGDHIWLGGCVLAYDIERPAEMGGFG